MGIKKRIKTISKKQFIKLLIFIPLTILVLLYFYNEAKKGSDFNVFLQAAQKLCTGENIYNYWYQVNNSYLLYFYSPLFALLLIPFSFLPYIVPNFIWLLANTFFTYRIVVILKKFIDVKFISKKHFIIILLISFALIFRFLLYNFDLIQMTIFMLYLSLESINLFEKKKIVSGAILLAFAINIKILPIVLIPYLLYRAYYKESILTIILYIVLIFFPAIIIGFEYNNFLIHEWWTTINPLNTEHAIEVDMGLHGLSSLIPPLLMETKGELEMKRNIITISPDNVALILNIVRFFFIALALIFLQSLPLKKEKSKIHKLWELSYLFLVIPLIFPHQQKYAFFFLFPATFYLAYFIVFQIKTKFIAISKLRFWSIIALLFIVFALTTLTTDGIIGRELNEITQHYKLVTYGTIMLIIPLFLSKPKFLILK